MKTLHSPSSILYIMSVPWGWIKQRPHFLAEGLSKYCKVSVYYKKSTLIKSKNLLTQIPSENANLTIKSFRVFPFHAIPFLRSLGLDFLNKVLIFFQIPFLNKYDYVWFPSPRMFKLVRPFLSKNQKVIYDCMDDSVEFGNSSQKSLTRKEILKNEKLLLERADFVFCSAEFLKEKILTRSGLKNKNVFIINNAIEIPSRSKPTALPPDVMDKLNYVKNLDKTMMYIGTIADWFDFETVIWALKEKKNYHLVLIGPSAVPIPQHPQIDYLGTMIRDYIFEFMFAADVLVMPFIVTELIKSVNPVKLYEYIYTGKPILAPRYSESELFSDYVYLYESPEGFLDGLNVLENCECTEERLSECSSFLEKNTWGSRCKDIISQLKNEKDFNTSFNI